MSEQEFTCPACGGTTFGRDTGDDGKGGVAVLKTVRCHARGCAWRGVWPPEPTAEATAEEVLVACAACEGGKP
jgi:hypothetical protein